MDTHHRWVAFGIALALTGCAAVNTDKEALRITPRSEVATSPVVREVLPQPAPPLAALPAPTRPPAATAGTGSAAPTLAHVAPALTAPPAIPPAAALPSVPPGTLYVCTATVNGQVQQTAIEFEPKVRQLCGKHPEMGVCQYEREACRASGGRVHTTTGVEITRQTENDYDKKVIRVRFRAG
jgi:hypothetical protein